MDNLYSQMLSNARNTATNRRQSTNLYILCLSFCADAMGIEIGSTPYPTFAKIQQNANQLYDILRAGYYERESSNEEYIIELKRAGLPRGDRNKYKLAEQLKISVEKAEGLYLQLMNNLDSLERD